MLISRELRLNQGGRTVTLNFGEAIDEGELDEVYRLRYIVYSKKGYIDPEKYPEKIEKDDYDRSDKSRHFIVTCEKKIIACARVIIDDPLPTERFFSFSEPFEMREINRRDRFEIGRLIIIPPDPVIGYLPRGLVMLFLYDTICAYAKHRGLVAGYAFIKSSLSLKMAKLKIPIHRIHMYKQNYPENGVLAKYFSQSHDPVIPVYFFTDEFITYANRIVRNMWLFKISADGKYELRRNVYTFFLRMLRII